MKMTGRNSNRQTHISCALPLQTVNFDRYAKTFKENKAQKRFVSSIGRNAFSECINVKEFKVDAENASYKAVDGVIFSKDGSELILYPPGRQTESYTIPDSVTKIRSSAFAYNSYITEIKFPDSTVEAEDYAFYFCDRLRNADFGNGLKKSEIMHFTVQS